MKTITTLLMTSALMLSSTAFAADPSTILTEKVAAALTEQLSLSSTGTSGFMNQRLLKSFRCVLPILDCGQLVIVMDGSSGSREC